MKHYDASVIIPTYNRRASLLETLASLAAQQWPHEQFEVIVVDDGSTDGTETIVDEPLALTLRFIRQRNQGSAVARNTGAKAAQGDILIFLDDDMLVGVDYVAGLIEEHRAFPNIVSMGRELPYLPENATSFARMAATAMADRSSEQSGAFVEPVECVTNNLSIEREQFFAIGMMQDVAGDGPTWWGDVDFGHRAACAGLRFRRSSKATCIHRDYSMRDLSTASERMFRVSHMAVRLFEKFPELRSQIPMFEDKFPVAWRGDSLRLVARKMARSILSSWICIRLMERLTALLERRFPHDASLAPLYRWITGAYIFQGFRAGLRERSKRPSATALDR